MNTCNPKNDRFGTRARVTLYSAEKAHEYAKKRTHIKTLYRDISLHFPNESTSNDNTWNSSDLRVAIRAGGAIRTGSYGAAGLFNTQGDP